MPATWRARISSGSRLMTRATTNPAAVATTTDASTPSLASSSCLPRNAMLDTSSEIVKPIPATVVPSHRTGQLIMGGILVTREASDIAVIMPTGLPTTYPIAIPSVIGDVTAFARTSSLTCTPAFASAKSGTMTKLVHGWSRYCKRSLAGTADSRPRRALRASSGVGCSRNSRASVVTRSRSRRGGGYAVVMRPTINPLTTGSIPDLSTATQMAIPSTTAAPPRHSSGAKRSATSTAKSPTATTSGTTAMVPVYTVAITTSAIRSSTTATLSMATRRRVPLGAISASTASARAVSVDIAAPQPWAPAPPALSAV